MKWGTFTRAPRNFPNSQSENRKERLKFSIENAKSLSPQDLGNYFIYLLRECIKAPTFSSPGVLRFSSFVTIGTWGRYCIIYSILLPEPGQ